MGLYNGTPGARRWRQVWSDHRLKDQPPRAVQVRARALREAASLQAQAA
jgi:tRNA-dihydrouridine synthase A